MRRRLPPIFSRPRREWWSLLWVRRCSVSSLMRSVSSATWTSAEPVSPSDRPYLPISSSFLSLVRPISVKTPQPSLRPFEASTQVSGLGHVAVHLRDQLLGARKSLLAAEPGDECDPQHLAVEVRVEVDQVRLDEYAAAGLERRPDAHVHRRR